jgi:NAD(P)-dependent dehydrogenase (short-subunit alcohol dehydrogenase family)
MEKQSGSAFVTKTVLITGAGSELGRSIAKNLAEVGYRVFASMREPFNRNREAANRLWSYGMDVVALDVTDEASINAAVDIVQRKASRIDVIINNARMAMIGSIEASTPAHAQEVLNTNVVGPIRIALAVLPYMRRHGEGLIVNIGSILGRVILPFFGIHSAGSYALEAVTDGLRYELSPYGIDVVLVQQIVSLSYQRLSAILEHDDKRAAGPTVSPSRRFAAHLSSCSRIADSR